MSNYRQAHMALEEQITPQDRQWERASTRIACNGPCDQGRKPCKTPQACEQPEEEQSARPFITLGLVVLVVACAMALPSFIHYLRGVL